MDLLMKLFPKLKTWSKVSSKKSSKPALRRVFSLTPLRLSDIFLIQIIKNLA